jgi:general nucleoside transport system permease protein
MNVNKLLNNRTFKSIASSIIVILFGLLIGYVILLISNPRQATDGFIIILKGGFNGGLRGVGNMLHNAMPIILTGLSVGFAFKTGLFNIGASGQFILGAFAAIYIGVKWTFIPTEILWIVALLGSMIAGALWGAIAGLLKAFRNVNEVISSIMLNYIGMYLVNFLVVSTVFDLTRNQSISPVKAFLPSGGMDILFPFSSANISIVIAIVVAIIMYIVLEKTTFGYELKAVGYNREASRYAGINEKKSIILSMMIAGALSGLGGGMLYLSNTGKHIEVIDVLASEGFNGIPVALLGLSNPIGIIFAGLFVGHMNMGGFYMQKLRFVPEVIDIMIAIIIYFSALSLAFKSFIESMARKLRGKTQ